jgi:tetratricopeptide (TPR) repeat protein
MKLYFTLLFLLLSQIGISQINQDKQLAFKKLLSQGEKAYAEQNFLLAKEIYTKVTDSISWNPEYWYNLAATELKLGENENACEAFYKIYELNHFKVIKQLREYCPNFRNETKYDIDEVDEKPKFIYKDKEYALIENNVLNPVYKSAIKKAFQKSSILREKASGSIYLFIHVNNNNEFSGTFLRADNKKEDNIIVKMEVMSILENTVTYISAKKDGTNVDLWNKWPCTIEIF